MKKIIYPEKKDWMEILRRPALNTDTLRNTVKEVLDKVKTEGDKAVREYEERFDKVKLDLLGPARLRANVPSCRPRSAS